MNDTYDAYIKKHQDNAGTEDRQLYEKWQIIEAGTEWFPKRLMSLADPPQRLYCMGDVSILKNRMAAVVGSRKSSSYGRWAAESIARALSGSGITVVSGMAKGIDAAAHRGAMDGNGGTVAVLGCGIDRCYPAEHRNLKKEIAGRGLVISEYPPGMDAKRWTFPKRNRIISALAEIVIVAEAGLNSGALITAEMAAEAGNTVMAVPANINSPYGIGSNKLIYDGAVPVVVIGDVLEAMGLEGEINDHDKAADAIGEVEKEVYSVIRSGGELSAEEVAKRLERAPGYVNGIIAVLEMKGLVHTSMGKVFVAK